MTRLEWASGSADCRTCLDRWTDPIWNATIHSVSIGRAGTAATMGQAAIEQYHHDRHRD